MDEDEERNAENKETDIVDGNANRVVHFLVNTHDVRGRTAARVPKRRKFADGAKWRKYQEESTVVATTEIAATTTISPMNDEQFTVQTRQLLASHIGAKLCGYKHQDIAKSRYNTDKFVRPAHICALVRASNGLCFYCSRAVLFVYDQVRDPGQWTLERVDNTRGHNADNVVLACLSCNLRRGTMHSKRFLDTQKIKFSKEDDGEKLKDTNGDKVGTGDQVGTKDKVGTKDISNNK